MKIDRIYIKLSNLSSVKNWFVRYFSPKIIIISFYQNTNSIFIFKESYPQIKYML